MDAIDSAISDAAEMIQNYANAPECQPFKPVFAPMRLLPNVWQPLVVLGARDAEMDCIEAICRAGSVPCVYAKVVDKGAVEGRRIRPGERITAENDATRGSEATAEAWERGLQGMEGWANIVAVEVTGGPALWTATEIDHHFNALAKTPATHAFEASSLGQFLAMILKHYVAEDVARVLGIEGLCDLKRAPLALRTEGAADHNLGATLRGDVRGIDPMFAAAYILKTRSATYLPGASWAEVLEVFKTCSRTLISAACHPAWGQDTPIKDLTAILSDEDYDQPAFNGEAYPLALRLLPVVAAFWGLSYAARIKTAHGWGLRVGGGGPNLLAAVKRLRSDEFCAQLGLKVYAPAPQNIYCFPERGIGGGTFE